VKHPKPIVRPSSIVLACADDNFYVTKIAWSSWGSASASGAGVAHVNNCTPNCAAGRFHTYPVTVRLDQSKACNGHSDLARVTWHFTGAYPKGLRSGTQTFKCA
jgi:hypothetical protein